MTHPDTKPEALRLADANDECANAWLESSDAHRFRKDTAHCLRRLHAECESLRTQLRDQALQSLSAMGQDDATIADLRTQLAEARAEAERHLNAYQYAESHAMRLLDARDRAQTLAADRLEQMTADRAQALRWRDEAEALRADARRFQTLIDTAPGCLCFMGQDYRTGDEFRAAIDAAMKEGE